MITPKQWAWETVVLIGGGPSLTQSDVDYCRDKAKTIAVNDAYRLAPWADVLYACDRPWWDYHFPKLNGFEGQKWTCSKEAGDKYRLNYVEYQVNPSISFKPGLIHSGQNSGFK